MRTVSTRIVAIVVIGIAVSLVGSSVPADTIYSTDFSDTTTGELPADWVALDSNATWSVNSANELVPASPSDDSSVAYNDGWSLTDYTVTTTFRKAGGRAGVLGRIQPDGVSCYSLRVKGNDRMELYWLGQNDAYGLVTRVYTDPDYVNDDMCKMTMTFEGSTITCEVRNSSDEVMAEWTGTDTTYAAGTAGLRADTDTFACDAFQIDVVPEPGVVILLISALAGLLIARRAR